MIKKKISMFKVDYSGWYKINARPSYIENTGARNKLQGGSRLN